MSRKAKKAVVKPKKVGRPTNYAPSLVEIICEKLSEGYSLRSVCEEKDMPAASTVFKWLRIYPEFVEQYARAKQESADAMAEDILDIADNATYDWMDIQLQSGGIKEIPDNEVIQRSKLRVETRKWIMAKMKPKKYGDKVDITSAGKAIKGNNIVFTDFSNGTTGKHEVQTTVSD